MDHTNANTDFMDYWKMLNDELFIIVGNNSREAKFFDAKGCYYSGYTPKEAAQSLTK